MSLVMRSLAGKADADRLTRLRCRRREAQLSCSMPMAPVVAKDHDPLAPQTTARSAVAAHPPHIVVLLRHRGDDRPADDAPLS